MNDHDRKWWRVFLCLLTGALAASVWAVFAGRGCGGCEGAQALVGGKTLAIVGAGYYALLLAAALGWGPSLPVIAGIQIAAGVHGSLLALLLHRGILCPPCIAASVAAVGALVVSLRLEPGNLARTTYFLPGAAFVLQAWLLFAGELSLAPRAPSLPESVLRDLAASVPTSEPQAKLVAFTRPDCGYCVDLERYVLPKLEEEFGKRLEIELRSAKDLPSLPTPTLLLSGPGGRRYFPGLPPQAELRAAVAHVIGDRREIQALLPEPR